MYLLSLDCSPQEEGTCAVCALTGPRPGFSFLMKYLRFDSDACGSSAWP